MKACGDRNMNEELREAAGRYHATYILTFCPPTLRGVLSLAIDVQYDFRGGLEKTCRMSERARAGGHFETQLCKFDGDNFRMKSVARSTRPEKSGERRRREFYKIFRSNSETDGIFITTLNLSIHLHDMALIRFNTLSKGYISSGADTTNNLT